MSRVQRSINQLTEETRALRCEVAELASIVRSPRESRWAALGKWWRGKGSETTKEVIFFAWIILTITTCIQVVKLDREVNHHLESIDMYIENFMDAVFPEIPRG